MPVLNRIASYAEEMKGWRRHLHANPELSFDCHNTAAFIIDRLKEIGVDEIHPGIAKTGIVAIINGQGDGPTIGLRADMDALPIEELTGAEYASTIPGKMHACGHDGHTAMLLGAAKYLTETRNFDGTVVLIFQPAEEGGGGKIYMARRGAFSSGDAAMMVHPADADLVRMHSIAIHTVDVEYSGRAAHAAAAPWARRCRAWACASSTTTAGPVPPARSAMCRCAGPTCSAATGRCPRRLAKSCATMAGF